MTYENKNFPKISAIVIEDDIELRELFVELLKIHNIHVMGTGSNGKEAYELYLVYHPDIVFTNLDMQKYDGYYGIQKIIEYDEKAKFIVISGPVSNRILLEEWNVLHIMEKPIDMKKIGVMINKIMHDSIVNKMK